MKTAQVVRTLQQLGMNVQHHFPVWYKKIRQLIITYPHQSITISVIFVFLTLLVAIPREGALLPADPNVVKALSLLSTTETGKDLIKRVKKSSAGSFIYLSLGTTTTDRLVDKYGDTVRGLTRVTYALTARSAYPQRVAVITNKDLVGTAPRDIIRNLAYELENVEYSFRNPQLDFPSDSPIARQTQKKIMEELNL
jgi:hypothetical protein